MERETFNVKTEPEEDLEYNLHHEEKFEIKTFLRPFGNILAFLGLAPTLDYLITEAVPNVFVSEKAQPGELCGGWEWWEGGYLSSRAHLIMRPSTQMTSLGSRTIGVSKNISNETSQLIKRQGNLTLSSLIGHDGTTQTKYKGEMYLFVQNKSLRREITYVKKRCEEEGCSKQARGREIDVLNTERFLLRGSVHKKAALNGLKVEVNVLNMEELVRERHVKKKEVKEGFGNQINLGRDRGLNPGPSAQKSDTLPLDHQVKEGFGNQINLGRDRGLNPGPSAQKSDTLPLDHQVTQEVKVNTVHI
uniref:Uncharacterized protein n=1 Tax=Timema tahoe TaxID=61484 RepID=A0A7R9IPR4_9NEOP|nr:unnamed protein product [Timema tahoe]